MGIWHRIFRTKVTLSGSWLQALWTNQPVRVPYVINAAEFLAQIPMPFLYPSNRDYVEKFKNDKTGLVLHWIVVLLHHPDEAVMKDVLAYWEEHHAKYVDSEVKMPYRTLLFDSVADHLHSQDNALVAAASRFIWRGYSKDNFENLFSIFRDPDFKAGLVAVFRLGQDCPPQHNKEFWSLRAKYFN